MLYYYISVCTWIYTDIHCVFMDCCYSYISLLYFKHIVSGDIIIYYTVSYMKSRWKACLWQTMSHNALECSKILPEDVLVIVNVNIIISLSARPMLLYKFRSRLINTELPENEANVVIYNTNLCITVFLWAEVIYRCAHGSVPTISCHSADVRVLRHSCSMGDAWLAFWPIDADWAWQGTLLPDHSHQWNEQQSYSYCKFLLLS